MTPSILKGFLTEFEKLASSGHISFKFWLSRSKDNSHFLSSVIRVNLFSDSMFQTTVSLG